MTFVTRIRPFLIKTAPYFIISCIVSLGLFYVLDLKNMANIAIPFYYTFDVLGVSSDIKNMIDHHTLSNIYFSPDLSAPYEYSSFTSYFIVTLIYMLIYIFSGIFNHYGTVLNLVYILGFYIVAWCCYWSLKQLKISQSAAVISSVLYTFLQYHFYRGEDHLALGFYWAVPLVSFVLITLYNAESDMKFSFRSIIKTPKLLYCSIISLLLGMWDLYYLVFSLILLIFVGILSLLRQKNISVLYYTFLWSTFAITPAIPILLTSYFTSRSLVSSAYSERTIASIEYYGLRLSQLLLPIRHHRLSFLANIREQYDSTLNIGSNESTYASLGLIISLGFIFSLIYTFTVNRRKKSDIILCCGLLNILVFLISSIGGISSFIGMVSSAIRCYNRMSVFIAFFSTVVLCKTFDSFAQYFKRRKKKYIWYGILSIICVVGIWDQTSLSNIPKYDDVAVQYMEDQVFVEQIETILPEGAMVFQLPILNATEECIVGMEHYAHYKPYLHSHSTRWLHRFAAGSPTDQLVESLRGMNINELLDTLFIMDFKGLYIDTKGYTNSDFNELTASLDSLLGSDKKIISSSGDKLFYSLESYNKSSYDNEIFRTFQDNWLKVKPYVKLVSSVSTQTTNFKSLYIGPVHPDDIITFSGSNIVDQDIKLIDINTGEIIDYSAISFQSNSLQLCINISELREVKAIFSKRNATIDKIAIYSSEQDHNIYAGDLFYTGDFTIVNNRFYIIHPGTYQFGPYASLDAGTYKITVVGENLDEVIAECKMDFAATNIPIDLRNQSSSQITYFISLKEAEKNIEFYIVNNTAKEAVIHYINIQPCEEP